MVKNIQQSLQKLVSWKKFGTLTLIYKVAKICIDILDSLSQNDCNYNNNGWTPTFTIEKLLISIISVLAESKITYVEKGFLNPQAAI
jgi:hypothetical protein